jgi:fluoride exporter
MNAYLYVAVGGVAGSVGRYWVTRLAAGALSGRFPWSTILVNLVGSFVIGFFSVVVAPDGALAMSAEPRTFAVVGMCGGFATVSFCLQTLELLRAGDSAEVASNMLSAVIFSIAAVILCIVAVMLGHALAMYIGAGGVAA